MSRYVFCHHGDISLLMSFSSDRISLAAKSSASGEKADWPQPKLWKNFATSLGNLSGLSRQRLQLKKRLSPMQTTSTLDAGLCYQKCSKGSSYSSCVKVTRLSLNKMAYLLAVTRNPGSSSGVTKACSASASKPASPSKAYEEAATYWQQWARYTIQLCGYDGYTNIAIHSGCETVLSVGR